MGKKNPAGTRPAPVLVPLTDARTLPPFSSPPLYLLSSALPRRALLTRLLEMNDCAAARPPQVRATAAGATVPFGRSRLLKPASSLADSRGRAEAFQSFPPRYWSERDSLRHWVRVPRQAPRPIRRRRPRRGKGYKSGASGRG